MFMAIEEKAEAKAKAKESRTVESELPMIFTQMYSMFIAIEAKAEESKNVEFKNRVTHYSFKDVFNV